VTFERHLFISYAHIDNQPLAADQQGWVTRFHTSLQAMLSMRIGHKAEIWRDQKISGNDLFADEIVQQFPKTALLVSVLSPGYVKSEWCTREIREFCRVAEKSGGAALGTKSRVIKVIKLPVDDLGRLPPLIKDMEGYEFYVRLDETPLELDPGYGPEMAQKYNLKLSKLALDVKALLEKLETANTGEKSPPPGRSSKLAVYLAQCSFERREARDALEAELRLLGYPILPEGQLPIEETECAAAVAGLLEQCSLSIHLVGSGCGMVPDGPSHKPVVVLQNELAARRSAAGRLRRVIWLPEGTRSQDPAQQRFIEACHNDAEIQFGADLITADLEGLKGAVHSALQGLERPEPARIERTYAPSAPLLVYLICDERDRPAVLPLRRYLKSCGIEVQIPVFEGNAAEVRQVNHDTLTGCDATLIFYGAGDEPWKRTMESDLRRNGFLRERPLRASYTYLAGPATADKKDLVDLEEPNLINGLSGFSEGAMRPFLEALRVSPL
jgi:TIR domain